MGWLTSEFFPKRQAGGSNPLGDAKNAEITPIFGVFPFFICHDFDAGISFANLLGTVW